MGIRAIKIRLNPLVREAQQSTLPRGARNARIAVSIANRFVFYRVPKVANSTILLTLARHDPHIQSSWHNIDVTTLKKQLYWRPDEIGVVRSSLALRSYFRFAFVRNPYTRVLSAYLDKVANTNNPRSAKRASRIRASLGLSVREPVSFGHFVCYLAQDGLDKNVHWAPQVDMLPDKLDFVGKFESLEEHLAVLIPRVFPGNQLRAADSCSQHATAAADWIEAYYNKTNWQLIKKLYQRDFERFGYCWALR